MLPLSLTAATKSRGGLKISLEKNNYIATLASGYHFNLEAPNKIVIDGATIPVITIKGRSASFGPLPAKWSSGKAALYVCDDAVTFCEPNLMQLKGTIAEAEQSTELKSDTYGTLNSHGFIEDDFNLAITQATKEKKLILIDFSARWCPGCVRYENETFDTKEFKNITADFIKVKIDVDRFENQVLSKKFNVNGIPTLLIVTPKQLELDRLIDYQPFSVLVPFFTQIRNNPVTIADLQKKALKDVEASEALAKRLVTAGKFEESLKYFSRTDAKPPEFLQAKVKVAALKFKEDPSSKNAYISTLKEAILAEPQSSRSIVWRTTLIGLQTTASESKPYLEEGIRLADELLKNPDQLKAAVKTDLVGEYTGFEDFLVAIQRADLIEIAKPDTRIVDEAWKLAASTGRKYKIPATRFGPALRYLIVLMKAKEFNEANTLSLALLKEQPDHGDLERRRIRILLELKKYKDAIALGQKAIKNSYGRNEFWVAESLAKALVANKQFDDAKSLIDSYLDRSDIDWSNLDSTKKSLEELKLAANKK